ncbi:hypothetical protein [Rhizobium sp. BK602]|uniref:hypothetical protein n=1 Tax=Rhizobium sp. BK602 TaxID=2586986 RepID=UPI001622D28B|nr:hypothetical protein [Rhizobium sp. BK602]MBB3608630.1 hypothetical protein [Rhizobium sp. BK602]
MSTDTTQLFRIHFEDGAKIDVAAKDAATANKAALARHDGIIRKTKIVREK